MNLSEIGQQVRSRRMTLGLSQAQLAAMCGLSRATVNQLENGVLADLGVSKLMVLLNLIGLSLNAGPQAAHRSALDLVTRSASVSYKSALESLELTTALVQGKLPMDKTAQIATLLDEVPLPLIVAAVEQVSAQEKLPPKRLWKQIFKWAKQLQSPRDAWA